MRITLQIAALMLMSVAASSRAEVVDAATNGFTVRNTIEVSASGAQTYRAVVEDIGRWWDASHTYSGDAANLSIDAHPGGCFCERIPGGGGVMHLTVVYAAPGDALRLIGGLGPLQPLGVAGSLSWEFEEHNDVTTIVLTYAVGGYASGGLERWAEPVDGMLRGQLTRLGNFLATAEKKGEK
jgi:hypothetical protein